MKLLKRGGIVAAGVAVAVVLATCGGAEELFQSVEERVAEAGAGETGAPSISLTPELLLSLPFSEGV